MREINLLPTRRKSKQEDVLVNKLKLFVSLILGITVILLITVFGYSFYLTQQISQTQTRILNDKNQISALNKNEGLYLLLKQKASVLTKIITGRYDFLAALSFFSRYNIPDVHILSLQLSESGTTIMRVRVANSYVLDSLLAAFQADGPDFFNRINLDSTILGTDGVYSISLTTIKK